jgi:hypothetical protein
MAGIRRSSVKDPAGFGPEVRPSRLIRTQAADLDAARYIAAVEAADGQTLEPAVRRAIHAFVIGCKADSIWSAIKASCILAGARTLTGALIPLAGTAPTNFNFVSGDYDRETGLLGNAGTKYLNSNRANNADAQNNQHLSVFLSTTGQAGGSCYINSDNVAESGTSGVISSAAGFIFTRSRSSTGAAGSAALATGFAGMSRDNGSNYINRNAGTNTTITQASAAATTTNVLVYRRNGGDAATSARIAFYSIGEAVDLAKLDTRVTALINAIAAAIP